MGQGDADLRPVLPTSHGTSPDARQRPHMLCERLSAGRGQLEEDTLTHERPG
jgi:hypothetical protein